MCVKLILIQIAILKNRSFMLSTCGFTCVTFATSALAWWGPEFMYYGLLLQSKVPNDVEIDE